MTEICQKLSVQNSILLSASRVSMPATIKACIDEGADPNIPRLADGYTPLMLAVWEGLFDNVKILVKAGAAINVVNNDDGTALLIAAQRGFGEIVEYFISCGANKTLADKDGDTALTVAKKMGYMTIVELLSR